MSCTERDPLDRTKFEVLRTFYPSIKPLLSVLMSLTIAACSPTGGGDSCEPEEAGCLCLSSSGDMCDPDVDFDCDCELEESGGETSAGETSAGETPAGETPAGETPAGETSAGETSAGETSAGETLAGESGDPCTLVECNNNERCVADGGDAECVCAEGFVVVDGVCAEPAQWSEEVIIIPIDAAGDGEVIADFESGIARDLGEWGTPSGSNCWSTSQRFNFWDGQPVFLALDQSIGAWKTITVTVTPNDPSLDPEVFAYLQPEHQRVSPPEFDGIGMCETSYSASSLGNEGEVERITFNTYAAVEPQNLLIGVANESAGEFTVRVEVRDTAERCLGDNLSPSAWPPYVKELAIDQEVDMYTRRTVYRSDLNKGAPMCELDWVWGQFCDVTTQQIYYEGNHTLFAFEQPEYSLQVVTVTPDPGVEVTLWGYSQGTTFHNVPPDASGTACEVSHPTDRLNRPINPGESESIEFYAFRNPYHNLIGVSGFGPDGRVGGFTVTVDEYRSASDACEDDDFSAVQNLESWEAAGSVNVISAPAGVTTGRGSLDLGEPLCGLAWMSNAFCVPDTQFHYFGGNHVFYAIDEPLETGQVIDIEVIPEPGAEVSLYGYQSGTTNYYVPPVVSSTVCEASHRRDLQHRPGYGEIEHIQFMNPPSNPHSYNIFFGVAGYTETWPPMMDDLGIGGIGDYQIKVTRQVSPPAHCPESLPGSTYSAWPGNVNLVALGSDLRESVSGDLSTGECVNLEFAEDNFCFPGTQDQHFEGNHVFYAIEEPMPPNSTMRITVTPDPDVEVSLYGYNKAAGSIAVPPMVRSAVSCEASYTLAGIEHTPNPGEPEVIEFQNPTNNSYSVFFGVAGDRDTGTAGAYTVDIEMQVSEPHCEESLTGRETRSAWPDSVNVLSLNEDEVTANGDLSDGACMNLDFAEQSFCFPGTQNQHFQGNHVFYALNEPVPPNSVLTITVEPEPDVEVSLYGWQTNPSDFTTPPYSNSTVCEASHTQNGIQHAPNPGIPETIRFYNPSTNPNSYGIFFAVAGDRDTGTSGGYTVKVSLDVGETFCPESLDRDPNPSCWPSDVSVISRGDTSGSLRSGACTNLSWADNSSVACFPGTASDKFDGNHVFYALEEPLGPNSQLRITATPNRARTDISLYAYLQGADRCAVPPAVGGVVSCEASHASFNQTNPGDPETVELVNPSGNTYQVFIGVAGASGATVGDFTLSVEESPYP